MCNLVPHERNFTQTPLSHFPTPRTVTASPAVRRPQGEKTRTKGRPCLLWVQEAACIRGLGGTGSSLLFPVCCIKKMVVTAPAGILKGLLADLHG